MRPDPQWSGPVAIHADVDEVLRSIYRTLQISIRPGHRIDYDFAPLKNDGGIVVGRMLEVDDAGDLGIETPCQREQLGNNFVRAAVQSSIRSDTTDEPRQTMQEWPPYKTAILDGELVVEFEGTTQAYLSFEHAMFPEDLTDDAKEVILLTSLKGPWRTREVAIAHCVEEGKRLMREAGYPVP